MKYAYRNTDWFVETVASAGKVGDSASSTSIRNDNPIAIYYDRDKKALYVSARATDGTWSKRKVTTSAVAMDVNLNQRTGQAFLTWLNRPKTDAFSEQLI